MNHISKGVGLLSCVHSLTSISMFVTSLWAATVGLTALSFTNTVDALKNGVARLPSK